MRDACGRAAPREACGLVAGGVLYELENAAVGEGYFIIRAQDVATIYERHGGYEAVWHTHPSGNESPSEDDWVSHPAAKAMVVATRDVVNVYYAEPEGD